MTRAEQAREYFKQGYACSQAVALAFADVMAMDEGTIKKIMLPFGGGLGRLRLTCGAVSGMAAVYGMVCASEENIPDNKKQTYAGVQTICEAFKKEFGSLVCADLLSGMNVKVEIGGEAEQRTPQYYQKRSCAEIVFSAAQILDDYLKEIGK